MTRRPQLTEFMRGMETDAVAIIASAREAVRSNDLHYHYRQDSDFYYLTGLTEPEAIAVIKPSHAEHKYTLFVRPRNPEREAWDGPRAGVEGATKEYGADAAFPIEEFGQKLGELLTNASNLYYRLGVDRELDETIVKQVARMRFMGRRGITPPSAITDPGVILHEMRLIKNEEELTIIEQAADIAAEAHREAMRAVRPGMYEYEIEALIEYIFRRTGASAPSYTSIVGGGANATVLHYVANDAQLHDGDLLLVDAGAEYHGYASDITRTFPVSGRFTDAQQDIYNLVLSAQLACIEMVRPGIRVDDLHNRSVQILTEGMIQLGLLAGDAQKLIEEEQYKKFYMHRIGHYLGMDVHDVGRYHIGGQSRTLEPGMVITIEPGLYIAPQVEGDVPAKYRGIGVRIEDDVLVTAESPRVLTGKVPKSVEEIEGLMSESKKAEST